MNSGESTVEFHIATCFTAKQDATEWKDAGI